jgi:hypothetical protein
LVELCANDLPEDALDLVSEFLGIDAQALALLNICAYTILPLPDFALVGELNKTYTLNIQLDGETYTSETSLLPPPTIDSLYFLTEPSAVTKGFGWCVLNDDPSVYNAYFFQTRRISLNEFGQPKDPFFFKTLNKIGRAHV